MSRKSNKPIPIPAGVTVTITNDFIIVKGKTAEIKQAMHPFVKAEVVADAVVLTVHDNTDKAQGAIWGTYGALVRNMLIGVTTGFSVQLEITGVGYQFDVQGKKLSIKAGFSHPVVVNIPDGVAIKQEKNVITLTSHDKQLVGQVAAEIRKIRKPEPYKGKGIKYSNEVILRKQGKQAAGSA